MVPAYGGHRRICASVIAEADAVASELEPMVKMGSGEMERGHTGIEKGKLTSATIY
jgi:hypothetical protein